MRLKRLSSALELSVLLLLLLCSPSWAQSNVLRFVSPPEAPSLGGGVGNVVGDDSALPLRQQPDKPLRVVARLAPLAESSLKPKVS